MASRPPFRGRSLIVTCGECTTSFELDESRIPPSGARVRCSRCKHAFFLAHPSSSQTEAVQSIVEETVGDVAAGGVPPAADDLVGLDGSIASLANPSESAVESDDEENWEFTEEVRTEGQDDLNEGDNFGVGADFSEGFEAASFETETATEAANEIDLDSGGDDIVGEELDTDFADDGIDLQDDDGSSGVELEVATDDIGDMQVDTEGLLGIVGDDDDVSEIVADAEAGRDDSGFGDVADFSALAEEVAPAQIESVVEEIHSDVSNQEGIDTSSGVTDDLSDPENWDLAPDSDFDSPKSSIAGLVDSFSPGSRSASEPAAASHLESDFDPADFDAEIGERSMLSLGLRTIATTLGWMITMASVSVVAYLSLVPEWQRWTVAPQTLALEAFSAETTRTRWVETSRSGSLLVIDGVAHNTGREVIWPPALQIALLDVEGEEISAAQTPIGSPLTERVLREATAAELAESMWLAPEQFRTSPLGPGESRAFQAIVADLPDGARRYVVEVADEAEKTAPPALNFGSGELEAAASAGREEGIGAGVDISPEPAPTAAESEAAISALVEELSRDVAAETVAEAEAAAPR